MKAAEGRRAPIQGLSEPVQLGLDPLQAVGAILRGGLDMGSRGWGRSREGRRPGAGRQTTEGRGVRCA